MSLFKVKVKVSKTNPKYDTALVEATTYWKQNELALSTQPRTSVAVGIHAMYNGLKTVVDSLSDGVSEKDEVVDVYAVIEHKGTPKFVVVDPTGAFALVAIQHCTPVIEGKGK